MGNTKRRHYQKYAQPGCRLDRLRVPGTRDLHEVLPWRLLGAGAHFPMRESEGPEAELRGSHQPCVARACLWERASMSFAYPLGSFIKGLRYLFLELWSGPPVSCSVRVLRVGLPSSLTQLLSRRGPSSELAVLSNSKFFHQSFLLLRRWQLSAMSFRALGCRPGSVLPHPRGCSGTERLRHLQTVRQL